MTASGPTLSPAELRRYSRQILLGELGEAGQRRLAAAKVLVIGAGGLGSPAALYLAAAGIGTLGLADHDRVEEHNLQRQLLHDSTTVGQPKTTSAATRLRQVNPHTAVIEHPDGITAGNALAIFSAYDVILDGTDNFTTRYLDNDAAYFTRRPLVYGSVFKFEGQVSVFDSTQGGPCYRCLFPRPPAPGSVPGCGEAGVLGALCGVIGSLQALEVLKLITGIGDSLRGRLLTYNALTCTQQTLTLPRDPHCPLCGAVPLITGLDPAHYATACLPSSMNPTDHPLEISVAEASQKLSAQPAAALLLDVREPFELDICRVAGAAHIPMRQVPERLSELPTDQTILVLCHHGRRSLNVTEFLRSRGYTAVSSIAGGIHEWAERIDPTLVRY